MTQPTDSSGCLIMTEAEIKTLWNSMENIFIRAMHDREDIKGRFQKVYESINDIKSENERELTRQVMKLFEHEMFHRISARAAKIAATQMVRKHESLPNHFKDN